MSKHTPGPWIACGAESVSIGGIEVGACLIVSTGLDDKHRDICCVTSKSRIEEGDIDNARLIATAPDLLAYAECEEEAYRPLCDIEAEGFPVMSRYGFRSDTVSAGRPLYAQVIDFLTKMRRAAIAKAEGK